MKELSDYWKGKRILITGGYGFLGKHLTNKLVSIGLRKYHIITKVNESDIYPETIYLFRSKIYDLRLEEECKALLQTIKPHMVIHLAANAGGIGKNMDQPGTLYYDNMKIGLNILHESYLAKVEKFVNISSICAYPKYTPTPFREKSFWEGYPEETNAPYGLAKKMVIVQAEAYRRQYGFESVHLLLANMYGAGDNFDPDNSHVIPGLIRKIVEAKAKQKDSIEIWGTGTASRDFLYVDDAVNAIILAIEKCNESSIMNIGTGQETTITRLIKKIMNIVGWQGKIKFNETKPDGQHRRVLDISRAKRLIEFEPKTSLDEGLKQTIEWYENFKGEK